MGGTWRIGSRGARRAVLPAVALATCALLTAGAPTPAAPPGGAAGHPACVDPGTLRVPPGADLRTEPAAPSRSAAPPVVAAAPASAGSSSPGRPPRRVVVDVVVHVVVARTDDPGPTPLQVRRTVRNLNDAYAGRQSATAADTGFRFRLVGRTRTVDPDWATVAPGTSAERQMKRALRVGGRSTLNVYVADTPDRIAWATFPTDVASRPTLDGVVVNQDMIWGGALEAYDDGDTVAHETGHWLGLEHPFEGGCEGGDGIADTPPEAEPAYDCTAGRDTCPDQPGLDPIHNFMDYTGDDCATDFTAGQAERMQAMWRTHRR